MKESIMTRMQEKMAALGGDGGTVLSTSEVVSRSAQKAKSPSPSARVEPKVGNG